MCLFLGAVPLVDLVRREAMSHSLFFDFPAQRCNWCGVCQAPLARHCTNCGHWTLCPRDKCRCPQCAHKKAEDRKGRRGKGWRGKYARST